MPILRPTTGALALALASGVELFSADFFTFTLVDGVTIYRWTSFDRDLKDPTGVNTFTSQGPYLTRTKWSVENTMTVPTLEVELNALNTAFNGGANIKLQIHNGLFDGATLLLQRAFMPTAGDTVTLGTVDLFSGEIAGIDLIGTTATLTVKGKVNKLDQYVPRNVYQIPCLHAFCDINCTLNRATFTTTFTVGASPTATFIPWSAAPGTPANYQSGTVAITTGAGAGQRRNVAFANSSGLTLSYPLYIVPAPGDSFTAFQGCDKTFNSGSGQSCTAYANTQHYRAFEFVPPPNSAV